MCSDVCPRFSEQIMSNFTGIMFILSYFWTDLRIIQCHLRIMRHIWFYLPWLFSLLIGFVLLFGYSLWNLSIEKSTECIPLAWDLYTYLYILSAVLAFSLVLISVQSLHISIGAVFNIVFVSLLYQTNTL